MTSNVEDCINKIKTDFDELISEINQRKANLLQTLNNISESKKNAMDVDINKMNEYLQQNNNDNNNNNTNWPSQREIDGINKSYQKDKMEIFYTNQNDKKRFISLMSNYGDISLPLEKPSILFARNNSRNYDIEFRWNIKLNDKNQYKITKCQVEWKNIDQKDNENAINTTKIDVIPNENNLYENKVNVDKDGNYSIRMQYFDNNLQVWSKMSDLKFVNIYKINEQFVTFDIFDKSYINIDNNMITGNGLKKGKYARMVSCDKGYEPESGLFEWRIKCVEYDSSSASGNASHAIGIFTNKEIAKNGTNWVNDKRINYAYYWNSYRRYCYGSSNGEYTFENNVNDGWNTGDVITVLLDCKKWTIQFSKNGSVVNSKPYKIKENQTYYPLIVMRSHNDKYQVMTYD